MLTNAGIAFKAKPADVAEAAIRAGVADPPLAAVRLAEAKAVKVSVDQPEAWVIGSDSIVSIGDEMFDKPVSREQAADHLRRFSGRTMILTSAVALARRGWIDWTYADQAQLKVRQLSENFIDDYLAVEWPAVGQCVGVFRIEGRGIQLFDAVEGNHFTVLGMPLLPLLSALRERGVIAG